MILEIMKFGSQLGMEIMYRKDICPEPLKMEADISYVEDDLENHKLDIIYPKKEKDSYPFIVYIHGGAFVMHSKERLYRNYGMRLAGDEFAVVNINYRLAPENVYPSQVEDVLLALQFISNNAERFKLDKCNMFIAGDSAGAYLCAITACVLRNKILRDKYKFNTDLVCRAIAANCGMFDFTTFMDKDVSFPMKRNIVEMLFGTADFENTPNYPFSSVLKYVNEQFPPIYLMDTKKKSFDKEALRLEAVLKKYSVEYKLHIFEEDLNLIHAFNIMSKYPQSNIVLREIFEFFKMHLEEK